MGQVGRFGDPCVERHTALIFDRGGARRIFQVVDLARVEWNREMDQKSRASLVITGRACREQSRALNSIEARRHELVLFRGADRVWEGPIVQTKSTSSRFELEAADIIEYFDYTALSKRWPNSDDPVDPGPPIMTERIRAIMDYELHTSYEVPTGQGPVTVSRWEEQDPPINVWPFVDIREGTTLTRAVTEAFQMSLGEHLYNLGRSVGVNYTTVGRRFVVWDGSLGRTRVVTEKDFSGDFEVIGSGGDFYTVSHVIATNSDEGQPPVVGHAANDRSYYGPWEEIVSTSSEDPDASAPSQEELNSQARRGLTGRYPLPIVLNAANGASLIPSAGITMNQLVAGVEVPVRATNNLRKVTQIQRLDSMKVVEQPEGETISATLSAIGEVESVGS